MSTIRLVIIASEEAPTSQKPLSAIFEIDQAVAINKRGIQVIVIFPEDPISIKDALTTVLRKLLFCKVYYKKLHSKSIIEIISILFCVIFGINKFKNTSVSDLSIFKAKSWVWSFEKLNKKENNVTNAIFKTLDYINSKKVVIDLVHAHNVLYSGFAAFLWCKKNNVPYFITEHSSAFPNKKIASFLVDEVRIAYKQAIKLFTVSEFLKTSLKEIYNINTPIFVLHNILNPLFSNNELSNQKNGGKFCFITVARLEKIKGIDLLLTSFKLAFNKSNQVVLKIIGDGEEREFLKKLSIDLMINDSVIFLGNLSRFDIQKELSNSNVFVSSSHLETFGVAIVEALSCGLPIVATKSGGPEGILNESNSILVEPNNAKQLSNAMKLIQGRYDMFSKSKIREDALFNFSHNTLVDKLIVEYNMALNAS